MTPVLTTLLVASLTTPFSAGPPPRVTPTAPLEYVSPLPGSHYHRPEATIILRPGGPIDARVKLDRRLVTARGSVSGDHDGRLLVSDDGETLIFEPFEPFASGEEVSWRLGGGLRSETRGPIQPREYTFFISGEPEPARRASFVRTLEEEFGRVPAVASAAAAPRPSRSSPTRDAGAAGEDVPALRPLGPGSNSPGYFFLCDFNLTDVDYKSHLLIADDAGAVIASHPTPGRALDFKVQPNGWMTYFDTSTGSYQALNADFETIGEFRCGNGYETDLHELQLLPDGHALLMAYDAQAIDMSQVVPGGRPRAVVIGLVVQELDRAKRVVFQWRSWDHFQITDATHRDFTAEFVDYAHGNSIDKDVDGDLLVSSRHMDEITKISRRTGEIVWRWGGKNNQFTIVNDPIGFSHQHDARRIANGNVTLFDNGFYHSPPVSRAVEYQLDEERKIATLVWEYTQSPPSIAFAMGSVQRLASGNTVIGWGSLAGTTVTEVTPAGQTVAGLALDAPLVSYRSFRFERPAAGDPSVVSRPASIGEDARRESEPFHLDRISGAGALPVRIRIGGTASSEQTVSVFDTRGRLVRRMNERADGQGRLTWDGMTTGGGPCASGVYFVRVANDRGAATLKVVVAR